MLFIVRAHEEFNYCSIMLFNSAAVSAS